MPSAKAIPTLTTITRPCCGRWGDCCAVVARGMGPRLVADFAAQGIDAYLCAAAEVDEAAKAFAAGSLKRAAVNCCAKK